jgi:hypothetical protein
MQPKKPLKIINLMLPFLNGKSKCNGNNLDSMRGD